MNRGGNSNGYRENKIKVLRNGLQGVLGITEIVAIYLLEQSIKKIYLHCLVVEMKRKWFVIIERLKMSDVKRF